MNHSKYAYQPRYMDTNGSYQRSSHSSYNSTRFQNKENYNPNNQRRYTPIDEESEEKNLNFIKLESPRESNKYKFYSKFHDSGKVGIRNFDQDIEEVKESKEENCMKEKYYEALEKMYGCFRKEIEFLEIKIEGFIRSKEKQMRILQVNLEILAQKVREKLKCNGENLEIFEELENENSELLEELRQFKQMNEKMEFKINKNHEIFKFKDEIIENKNLEIGNLTKKITEILSKVDNQKSKITNLKEKNIKLEKTIDKSFMQFEAQIKDILKSQKTQSSMPTPRNITKRSKEITKQFLGRCGKSSSKKKFQRGNSAQKKRKEIEKKNDVIKKLKTLNQEYLRTIEMLQGELMLIHEENKSLVEKLR